MAVPEILVNQKIVYSTKHIIKTTLIEIKIIEQTLTVVRLDMEESNKDTTETQAKTISTT